MAELIAVNATADVVTSFSAEFIAQKATADIRFLHRATRGYGPGPSDATLMTTIFYIRISRVFISLNLFEPHNHYNFTSKNRRLRTGGCYLLMCAIDADELVEIFEEDKLHRSNGSIPLLRNNDLNNVLLFGFLIVVIIPV
jgi:hypothetical protein